MSDEVKAFISFMAMLAIVGVGAIAMTILHSNRMVDRGFVWVPAAPAHWEKIDDCEAK